MLDPDMAPKTAMKTASKGVEKSALTTVKEEEVAYDCVHECSIARWGAFKLTRTDNGGCARKLTYVQ